MPKRVISVPTAPPKGVNLDIPDGDVTYKLHVPDGYKVPAGGEVELTIHFHGAPAFALDEHRRRGLDGPIIAFSNGEGSSRYAAPFKDAARLGRWVKRVEEELKRRGGPDNTRVAAIDVSSFSAGYGAVREIVKSPEYVALLRRVVLADSMYAGFEPGPATGATTGPASAPTSRPMRAQIEPWLAVAKPAASEGGGKTFVLTFSQVPTPTYASSSQCAAALVEAVGGELEPVQTGSLPATEDPDFPLLTRCDIHHFHVWGYGGDDAQAHMTHPRHIADVWKALDAAGAP